ncbi:MAG: 1-phosphofructokinase [Clostridiales bacterium]|nr:1-phosphofructokinase [Clostridiales bacterium]
MIYTVTLNPALDKTAVVPFFAADTVNRIVSMRTDPGGKGINVSKVIDKLGGKSVAVCVLGGESGRAVFSALNEMGLALRVSFVQGETRTNLKIVDPKGHTNTDINEPGAPVPQETLDRLLEELASDLEKDDLVVISGSLPPGAPEDTYYRWVKTCREAGAKVFLDAPAKLLKAGIAAGPYLVKPNRQELSGLVGRELHTPEKLEREARRLLRMYGVSKAVVSMGSEGAVYVTEKESVYAEGLSVPVGSTVGAGDSVVAALAVAEQSGMDTDETVRLFMAAGAANVMCDGSQAAEYEAVERLCSGVVFHRMRRQNEIQRGEDISE